MKFTPHFTNEEPKAQRGRTTCPLSHSTKIQQGTLPGAKPRPGVATGTGRAGGPLQDAIPPGLLID